MRTIKVRKIGNSVGLILPKTLGLQCGDVVSYTVEGHCILIDMDNAARAHDRQMIEESFADFEKGMTLSQEEIHACFAADGWGE